jgi:hypothetical protein
VPAAFDDEPDVVTAREIDRCGDIGGALGRYDIGTRRRLPRVEPAGVLCQASLLAHVERVGQ